MAGQVFAYISHRQGKADDAAFELAKAAAKIYPDAAVTAIATGAGAELDAVCNELTAFYKEVWKFDNEALAYPIAEAIRKLLLNVNKGGYAFVVDRTNGEFISAWPVAENINWIKGVSSTGELLGRNEPVVGQSTLICPSIGGGRSWNQGSFSPRTGWFYTTGIEWCQQFQEVSGFST